MSSKAGCAGEGEAKELLKHAAFRLVASSLSSLTLEDIVSVHVSDQDPSGFPELVRIYSSTSGSHTFTFNALLHNMLTHCANSPLSTLASGKILNKCITK